MSPTTRTMQDWLKVHRALMEAEARMAELAAAYDVGGATRSELSTQNDRVEALRALAREVFDAVLTDLGP